MKNLKSAGLILTPIAGLLLTATPFPVSGQSILKKIKGQVEETATRKVLSETDKAVSEGIDKAVGSAKEPARESTGDGNQAHSGAVPDTMANKPASIEAYSKYDFVPGDSVLYANDFSGEAVGELPVGWNSNGNAVMVTLGGIAGQWLRMAQRTVVLTDNEQPFGSDFTVEFDMVLQFDFKGWLPPALRVGLLASGAESSTANKLLSDPKGDKSLFLELSPLSDGANLMLESYEKYIRYFYSPSNKNTRAHAWYGKSTHIAIQGQKERLRIWADGEKIYDVPKGIPKDGELNQLFFQLSSSPYEDEQVGVYISNIKIAKGLPDTRHKLVEEGRFSTTGILFDTGSATIKPESAGMLKSIASVLTQHPDLRVQVIGHTDAVGDDAANLELSERRAAAVKEILQAEYNIEGVRLEASGKGETEPIGDNQTSAGRAQNRRVEFIKL